jgi:hypothetical protein
MKEGKCIRLAELIPSYKIIHAIYSDENGILARIGKMIVMSEIK